MNDKQKTLVILTPGFPASESDCTCLPLQQELVRAINKTHPCWKVVVLSFQYPYRKGWYEWYGNAVMSFDGRNRGGLRRLWLRKQVASVLRQLNGARPLGGLLSFWYGECAIAAKSFGDRHGIRHYCWLLGQDARKDNPYPARLRFHPSELVALSDFLQAELERNHGLRPFAVIAPGVDTGRLHAAARQRDIDLLAVGSLIPLKQFAAFLEVVAEIKKTIPGIKAVLAGEGLQKENLLALARQLNLQEQVILTGALPFQSVLNLMQRAKILLHPSAYEGFSGVCLEAVKAGAHVISFCRPMSGRSNIGPSPARCRKWRAWQERGCWILPSTTAPRRVMLLNKRPGK